MFRRRNVTFDDGNDIPAAVAAAKDADVVILGLGEREGISGEGHDRSNLDLPGNQEQLLEAIVATGKPAVLVLENGTAADDRLGETNMSRPSSKLGIRASLAGTAIAETLFGDNNPAGRLTITFPADRGQLPDFYNSDPSRRLKYVDDDGQPLFPFGFGLSYTTFRYDHLVAQPPSSGSKADIQITVDVTNTGSSKATRWRNSTCAKM